MYVCECVCVCMRTCVYHYVCQCVYIRDGNYINCDIYSSLAVINIVPFLLLTFNHEEKVDVPPSKNQALCQLN